MLIARRNPEPKKGRLTYRIGLSGLILITALTTPPLLEIVSFPLNFLTPTTPTTNADAIVVLGGGIDNNGLPSPSSMARAYTGGKLLLEGKAPLLILATGRTNPYVDKSEAEGMSMVAAFLGIPKSKIILEEKSFNTYTNALETKKILDKYNVKSIILVTSFTHSYRAYLVFKKQGINVIPFVEKRKTGLYSLGWSRANAIIPILHEYGGIILYKFKGWL